MEVPLWSTPCGSYKPKPSTMSIHTVSDQIVRLTSSQELKRVDSVTCSSSEKKNEILTQKYQAAYYSTVDIRFPCSLRPEGTSAGTQFSQLYETDLWRSPVPVKLSLYQTKGVWVYDKKKTPKPMSHWRVWGRGGGRIAAVVSVISKPAVSNGKFSRLKRQIGQLITLRLLDCRWLSTLSRLDSC